MFPHVLNMTNIQQILIFFLFFFNMVYVTCCTADPEGIAAAQKSIGIGQEDRDRRVR
jgi:hypothetical protein